MAQNANNADTEARALIVVLDSQSLEDVKCAKEDCPLRGVWLTGDLFWVCSDNDDAKHAGIIHPRKSFSLKETARSNDIRLMHKWMQSKNQDAGILLLKNERDNAWGGVPLLFNGQSGSFLEGVLDIIPHSRMTPELVDSVRQRVLGTLPSVRHNGFCSPSERKARPMDPEEEKRDEPEHLTGVPHSGNHPDSRGEGQNSWKRELSSYPLSVAETRRRFDNPGTSSDELRAQPGSMAGTNAAIKNNTITRHPVSSTLGDGSSRSGSNKKIPPPPPPKPHPLALVRQIRFGYLRKPDKLGFWVARMVVFDSRQSSLIYASFDKAGALMPPEHIVFERITRAQLSVYSARRFEVDEDCSARFDLGARPVSNSVVTHEFLCDDDDDAKEWVTLIHSAAPRLKDEVPPPPKPVKPLGLMKKKSEAPPVPPRPSTSSRVPLYAQTRPSTMLLASPVATGNGSNRKLPIWPSPNPGPIETNGMRIMDPRGNAVDHRQATIHRPQRPSNASLTKAPPPPPPLLTSPPPRKSVPPPPPSPSTRTPSISTAPSPPATKAIKTPPPPPPLPLNTSPPLSKMPKLNNRVSKGPSGSSMVKIPPPPPPKPNGASPTTKIPPPPPPMGASMPTKMPPPPPPLPMGASMTSTKSLPPPPPPMPISAPKPMITPPPPPPQQRISQRSTLNGVSRQQQNGVQRRSSVRRPRTGEVDLELLRQIHSAETQRAAGVTHNGQIPVWMLPRSSRPREAPPPPPRTTRPGFYNGITLT